MITCPCMSCSAMTSGELGARPLPSLKCIHVQRPWVRTWRAGPCRGQNIRSSQSHKSYRPLAVLVFRLIRQSWRELARRLPCLLQWAPLPMASPEDEDPDGLRRLQEAGELTCSGIQAADGSVPAPRNGARRRPGPPPVRTQACVRCRTMLST